MAFQRYQVFEELLFRPYAVQHRGVVPTFHARFHPRGLGPFDREHVRVVHVRGQCGVPLFRGLGPSGGGYLPGAVRWGYSLRDTAWYGEAAGQLGVSFGRGERGGFCMLFAQIMLLPLEGIDMLFVEDIPAWVFGILYLVYSYAMDMRGRDNVARDAHFYGAVFQGCFLQRRCIRRPCRTSLN